MIEKLRNSSQAGNLLIKIPLALIALVFILQFNPGTRSGGCSGFRNEDHIGSVLGRSIQKDEFIEAQASMQRFLSSFSARSTASALVTTIALSSAMGGQGGLDGAAKDLLFYREALSTMALGMGFAVSEDEILLPTLPGRPAFTNKDGAFEEDSFKEYVSYRVHTSMKLYREDIRRQLLAEKMAEYLTGQVRISDDEVKSRYMRDETRATVEFVKFFVAQNRADATASPEEAQAYAMGHDAEIKAYYDEHKDDYGPQVKARHILIKVAKTASQTEVDAAKQKIDDLSKQLAGGADFVELAKANSQDSSAQEGGDLGWFGKGRMVAEFEKVAFETEPGKISAPLRSPFGFHIIKVDEKKGEQGLDAVKTEVAQKLAAEEKAKKLTQEKAEAFLAKAKALSADQSLSVLVAAAEEEVPSSAPTSAPASSPASAPSSQPKKLKNLNYTLGPDGKLVPAEDPYALKTDTISLSLAQSFSGNLDKIGKAPELSKAIFALTKEKPVAEQTFAIGDAIFVVRLTDRSEPDMEKFKTDSDRIKTQYVDAKKYQLLRAWLDTQKQKALASGGIDFPVNTTVVKTDEE